MARKQTGVPASGTTDAATLADLIARTPPIVVGTTPPTDTTALWVDTN